MLKRLVIIGTMVSASVALALPSPLLVLDARNADKLPKKFRFDNDLRSAGSAQFSERNLVTALDRIHGHKVTIVDLRQESHGYLNGNAISWYAKHDAINEGLSDSQIRERESKLLSSLAKTKIATVYNIKEKTEDGTITAAKPQEYMVRSVSSEDEIAHKHHLKYKRIYVQDFHAPSAKAVDQFVNLVKKIPQDQWLYFHCRGGSGRTTSFMAMYEMMRNAKNESFEEIIAHQKKLGGKDLSKLPDANSWKYTAAAERLELLKKFYEYAKNSDADFSQSFSDWLKGNS